MKNKAFRVSDYPIYFEHDYTEWLTNGRRIKKLPPIEILEFLFAYDPETGILTRKIATTNSISVGDEAGRINHGYRILAIADSNRVCKTFNVHRIIYKMMTKEDPTLVIDHIDGDRLNNKWDNLRLATSAANSRNVKMHNTNTSGFTGVSFHVGNNCWQSYVKNRNKLYALGQFKTMEEAVAARKGAIKGMNILLEEEKYTDRHGLRRIEQ